MKERPIIFSGESPQLILDGRKTQTRRVVAPQQSKPKVPPLTMEPWLIDGERETDDHGVPCWAGTHPDYPTGTKWFSCPYGAVGWRLWGRESLYERGGQWFYKADDAPVEIAREYQLASVAWAHHKMTSFCSSMFMPRWASRLSLEIVEVRVQRIQDIVGADVIAEGIDFPNGVSIEAVSERWSPFRDAWDGINAKRGPAFTWASNPWVWAITFKQV